MTHLRDARLQRALQAAEDEVAQPSAETRDKVLRAAREAAAASDMARPAWWRDPHYRLPLNAAFASLLIAAVIGVMWYEREPPGAKPESDIALKPAAPAPAPASASAPASAPAPAPAAPGPLADRTEPLPPLKAQPPARAPLAKDAAAPPVREEARQRGAGVAADESKAESANIAAPPAAAARVLPAPAPAPAPAIAPPRMQEAAPAAAPPPVQAPIAPRAAWEDWSEARIEVDGRAVTVPRGRAFRLAELLYAAINAPATSDAGDIDLRTRVMLTRYGLVVGTLDVGTRSVRWQAGGTEARTAQPAPEALRQLRDEVLRLSGS